MDKKHDRRDFIKKLGLAGTALASAPAILGNSSPSQLMGRPPKESANDNLQIALIGAVGL